jgi:hypothetical protein
VTKGWAQTHSVPERLYTSNLKNYLKVYYTIKTYLDTQGVKLLSFQMTPQETTTVIAMNIFWYKPIYRQDQSRRSKIFKPWTGWQSRWSRPPLTLWRPRMVQHMTNERKILQAETSEEIDAYATIVKDALAERRQKEEQIRQQQGAQ